MLNLMRRSVNTWIIKTLLVLIALSFVVWGVGDYVNTDNQRPVAEGKGWVIHPQEFASAYEEEFNSMKQRFGGVLDKRTAELLWLKQSALNTLIHRHVLLSMGRDLRLAVSGDTLREMIAGASAFQVGGQFNSERYRQLVRNNRLTPAIFESQLTADIITGQIRSAVGSVMGIPDLLVQDVYRLENEKRVVDMLTLRPKVLEEGITPTEQDLLAFLQEHQDRFMTPTRTQVQYVVLDAASVTPSITISPEEIKAFYEENPNDFQREETRRVRHILAREGSGQTPGDTAGKKSALERIQQAQAQLGSGVPFAEVARALSDDVSKSQGGDLGEFSRGMMVPAFDGVAFSLPVGQVSDPVKTEFGYHLILVDAIQAGVAKTLEEASDEIRTRLLARKAQDVVYERSTVLEDQIYVSGDLRAIATDLNLRFQETGFFSREEGKKATGLEHESVFLDTAFATPVGETSGLVELKGGQFMALKVLARKAPAPKTLGEVRDALINVFRNEKAHDQAQALMTRALTLLQEGGTWEEAAKIHEAARTDASTPFTRRGGQGAPSPAIRAASFKLSSEQPLHTAVLQGLEEFVLIRLKIIVPADPKGMPEAAKTLRPSLQAQLGQEQMEAFLRGLQQDADIQIHPDVLERF